jgi:hypothetical protein
MLCYIILMLMLIIILLTHVISIVHKDVYVVLLSVLLSEIYTGYIIYNFYILCVFTILYFLFSHMHFWL